MSSTLMSPMAMPDPVLASPAAEAVAPPEPVAPAGRPMERLGFTLPDFTRVIWVSDAAREVWAPRLTLITTAWQDIEWRAVLAGVRRCAITTASPEEFVAQAPRWVEEGLCALPVEMMGVSGQPYSATRVPTEPAQPFVFRFVLGRPVDVAGFKRAWDAADDEAIGDLLGYPACCREFFRRVWVDDAMLDTTWPMAVASVGATDDVTTVEVHGPTQSNILWRWMGARPVPHLPCRFDCPATVALADRLVAVGRDAGFGEEMDWLLEVLSWPVEWSALHGIAEIKTPVLKVSTRTDATARRYAVRRHGDGYPAEGVRGLDFPYRTTVKLHLTRTRGFRRGLDHAAGKTNSPAWYAADNGFASVRAMDEAHAPVVRAAAAALGGPGGAVLDLGCGNGVLLERLVAAAPGVVPFGIDRDPVRIEHAQTLHRKFANHFAAGDMFDDERLWAGGRRFALAVVMPGRLLETDTTRAAALRERLRSRCDQVLVYAYGDWLAGTTLAALAQTAGFSVSGPEHEPAALATVGTIVPEEVFHGS